MSKRRFSGSVSGSGVKDRQAGSLSVGLCLRLTSHSPSGAVNRCLPSNDL